MTEIKAGKCYMCLRDIKGYDSFTKGKVYPSLSDNALINDNHIEVLVRPGENFRIATEQEIKAQKDLKKELAKLLKECGVDAEYIHQDFLWVIARHFAEWGKKQAEIEIQSQSMALAHGCPKELASDAVKAAIEYCGGNKGADARVRGAFVTGSQWKEQQMMKQAVSLRVSDIIGEVGKTAFYIKPSKKLMGDLKKGDKVKMLVIKED